MAKRVVGQDGGADKGGMEILYIKVNGNNTTLQEGMRTLVEAMNRPVQVASTQRKLVANHTAEPIAAQEQEPDLFNQEPIDGVDATETEQTETSQNGSTRRKRGEGVNRDRNAGLSIVKSLNLQPEGKVSLKEFVANKKPKKQNEHIAVYIYYLKNILDEPNVGFSHIYTCFKETGTRMPGDLPQSCRNTASKKGWIDTANANDLKRTTRGDNLVEKDLPLTTTGGGDEAK